ncbi:MAG TPA: GNAT family N-acetyltransferase [Polyangiaceae bacterium]|nr:GNAT family N-acetyltransferase [Polyangiaceae bacterium]
MNGDSNAPDFACEALAAQHAPPLSELFERAGSGCYCEWWHFEGDKNAWLARLAEAPEQNRARLAERAVSSSLAGVVALSREGDAVGWMKLTWANAVPKLYAQRPYRGLPLLRENGERVATVGCFLVDPAWRKRGISGSLLQTGIELARRAGAVAIEAFPRRADGLRDEELWTGPHATFVRLGFEPVHEVGQYPVLRRIL